MDKEVIALYTYEAESSTELGFIKGQRFIRRKEDKESGWSQGELDGVIGWFPSEFVEKIEEEPIEEEPIEEEPSIEPEEPAPVAPVKNPGFRRPPPARPPPRNSVVSPRSSQPAPPTLRGESFTLAPKSVPLTGGAKKSSSNRAKQMTSYSQLPSLGPVTDSATGQNAEAMTDFLQLQRSYSSLSHQVVKMQRKLDQLTVQTSVAVEASKLYPAILKNSTANGAAGAGGEKESGDVDEERIVREGKRILNDGVDLMYKDIEDDELASGWLEKKGRQRKNWKRRWFVLKGSKLSYYEKPGDRKVVGEVNFDTCVVEPPMERPDSGRKCMALIVEGRKLLFIAESESESYAWFLLFVAKNAEMAYAKKARMMHQNVSIKVMLFLQNPFRLTLDLAGEELPLEAAGAFGEVFRYHHMLTTLCLKSCGMDDLAVSALRDGLAKNETLTEINVAHNRISGEGLAALAAALKGKRAIRDLRVHGNNAGARGVSALADMARATPALRRLKMGRCAMNDIDVDSYSAILAARHNWPRIDLPYNAISDDGMAALANAISSANALTDVDLLGNPISVLGMLSMAGVVAAHNSIRRLRLGADDSHPADVAEVMRILVANRHLEFVQIGSSKFDIHALSTLRVTFLWSKK